MRYKNFKTKRNLKGLTSLDFFVSLSIFTVFISVFLAVAQIIIKFSSDYQGNIQGSPGTAADQHKIFVGFERLINVLSQPGFARKNIISITNNKSIKCTVDPSLYWGIPGEKIIFPTGYKICLSATPSAEANLNDLIGGSKAGIYVLHAIPEQTNSRYLPLRKIFCRPKPYC
tara:strand:+ start:5630 stop:6145 length:516 start_codon:yes stop_codon:yes gene_type:complete